MLIQFSLFHTQVLKCTLHVPANIWIPTVYSTLQTTPAILFTHLSIRRPTFPADAQFPMLGTRSAVFSCTQPQLHAFLTPHIQAGRSH